MIDNEVPSLQAIRESLVTPDHEPNRMRISRAARSGTLARIARGIYLPTSTLEGHPLWLQKTIVRGSRICALSMRRHDHILTGECAGWILGLPVITDKGPITAYAPISCGERRLSFHAVHIGSKLIMPAGQASIVRTSLPAHQIAEGFAIPFAPRIVVDCARLAAKEQAFALTCAGIARLANYSRFDQLASRERAEQARHDLLRELASLPRSSRGTSQARWVISHADAGCESPGESRVLHALILAGIKGITTQEEVRCSGHTFFIDIALPGLKIAIEFDGRIKYGDSVQEVHETIEAEQRRARLLQLAGWRIIRIRWSDLRRLDEVVAQVLVAIRQRAGR